MIRKFLCKIDTGFCGATIEEEIEVDTDDFESEEEITDHVWDYVESMKQEEISTSWEEIEQDEEEDEDDD